VVDRDDLLPRHPPVERPSVAGRHTASMLMPKHNAFWTHIPFVIFRFCREDRSAVPKKESQL